MNPIKENINTMNMDIFLNLDNTIIKLIEGEYLRIHFNKTFTRFSLYCVN